MADDYLIDTSVLTRLRSPDVRARVEALGIEGRLARATISDLEIGYSARNEPEWQRLTGALDAFTAVEVGALHMSRALQVQRLLARASQRGRKIPDLLVAAAAESAGLIVLHYDADFDLIASVTQQPCEWVVPAGSVD